ncbi:hypothetical protein [Roseicella sp. DB1501]|uniref:hypothetical protein n=1 Tax=Roseicella sp. DB1501 TaxID=2730925 RepID=UPI001492F378|nr:hypothetical protein [Roseicella sp. DB1501]NOG68856.1 hypothetical protein [Roseicella sp. DB1501]
MDRRRDQRFAPGASVLGGAAGGLSYEGLMRDAVAVEERSRWHEAGRIRILPRRQVQAPIQAPVQVQVSEPDHQDQARIAGR